MCIHIVLLLQVMHDVTFLGSELSGVFLGQVIQVLGSCSDEVVDLVRQSILQAGKNLEDLLPAIMDTMVEAIVEKSVEVNHISNHIKIFANGGDYCYEKSLLHIIDTLLLMC